MTNDQQPKVMWIELFQDVVVVVMVTALAEGLINSWGQTWMVWYVIAMLALYAVWSTNVLLTDRFPSNSLPRQVLTMIWMVGGMLVAGGMLWRNWLDPSVLNVGVALMLGSSCVSYYLAGRHHPELRRTTQIVTTSTALGAIIGAVAALPIAGFEYLVLPAVVIALAPVISTYLANMPGSAVVRPEHVQERFGQLVIILLGAMFLELMLSVRDAHHLTYYALAVGSAILFLMFRAYFQHVMPLGVPTMRKRFQAWIGVHTVLVFGFGFAAVALARMATHEIEGAAPEADEAVVPELFAGASVSVSLFIAYVGLALVAWYSQNRSAYLARIYALCAVAILVIDSILRLTTGLSEPQRATILLALTVITGVLSTRYGRRSRQSV